MRITSSALSNQLLSPCPSFHTRPHRLCNVLSSVVQRLMYETSESVTCGASDAAPSVQIPSVTLGRPSQTNSERHAHGRRLSPEGLGRLSAMMHLNSVFVSLSHPFVLFSVYKHDLYKPPPCRNLRYAMEYLRLNYRIMVEMFEN